ncbi:Hsp20/alpha crystallin family protein [archaeon]|nr:MAG: Hsp20/alpha crystallin family protein [archaeon]HDN17588.1 Hsp20/alpha crystallin family protein [Candidatus Bathyarchaeota archaeon]
MSEDWYFDEWFRRWLKRGPFRSFFMDLDEWMEEMFKDLEALENVPKRYIRERKLPDGRTVREYGPFVYGYSIKIGPDGKPEIREFGNFKPSGRVLGSPLKPVELKEEREPLTDIIDEGDKIRIVAELPGVEKDDIQLKCDGTNLVIKVDTEKRKYYKVLKLPSEVEPKSADASYKNGVLDVVFKKKKKEFKGETIRIK